MPAAAVIGVRQLKERRGLIAVERIELVLARPCDAKRVPGSIVSWYSERCEVPATAPASRVADQPASVSPGSA